MKRILGNLETYNKMRAEGKIDRYDEVFLRTGHLCFDDVIIGDSSKNKFYFETIENGLSVSEFKIASDISSNNTIVRVVPIDLDYINNNKLAYIKFIERVFDMGLKAAKDTVDTTISVGQSYEIDLLDSSKAAYVISSANNYTAGDTFNWRLGVRVLQTDSTEEGDPTSNYILLYKGNEVATKVDLQKLNLGLTNVQKDVLLRIAERLESEDFLIVDEFKDAFGMQEDAPEA